MSTSTSIPLLPTPAYFMSATSTGIPSLPTPAYFMSAVMPVILPPGFARPSFTSSQTPPHQQASDPKIRLGELKIDVIDNSILIVRQVRHVALARHCSVETLERLYELLKQQRVLLSNLTETTQ